MMSCTADNEFRNGLLATGGAAVRDGNRRLVSGDRRRSGLRRGGRLGGWRFSCGHDDWCRVSRVSAKVAG